MAIIRPYMGKTPKIDNSAYIAQTAVIIGDVEIGANSSVWDGCVIRGDVSAIRIGSGTNIQDGSVIHVTRADEKSGSIPTVIGDNVTIGHRALLHACNIEDYGFVGMGAILLDNSRIAKYGMLGAGALLSPGKIINSEELWVGLPAKFFRKLSEVEKLSIEESAINYIELSRSYSFLS